MLPPSRYIMCGYIVGHHVEMCTVEPSNSRHIGNRLLSVVEGLSYFRGCFQNWLYPEIPLNECCLGNFMC